MKIQNDKYNNISIENLLDKYYNAINNYLRSVSGFQNNVRYKLKTDQEYLKDRGQIVIQYNKVHALWNQISNRKTQAAKLGVTLQDYKEILLDPLITKRNAIMNIFNENYNFTIEFHLEIIDTHIKRYARIQFPKSKIDFKEKSELILKEKIKHKRNLSDLNEDDIEKLVEESEKIRTQKSKIEKIEMPKLSLKEIALLYYYNDHIIKNDNNANEIARSYGYNSGQKLYQEFTTYSTRSNRIYVGDTYKKAKHHEKRFNKIKPHIIKERKELFDKEFKLFSIHLEKQY